MLSVWAVIIDWRMGIFRESWARAFQSPSAVPSPSLDGNAQQLSDVQRHPDRAAALSSETRKRLRSMRHVINRLLGSISDAQVLNGWLAFDLVLEGPISQL